MARSSRRAPASEPAPAPEQIRRTPGARGKSAGRHEGAVRSVDLAALEQEVEQTRARLARIIGDADGGLQSIRRRARLRQAVLAATR